MRRFKTTTQFERDFKRVLKRGKDRRKMVSVMGNLIKGKPLRPKYRDHSLHGAFQGRRECHIEPDWLLIYKLSSEVIIFERTGTHADLFG